MGLFGKCLDRLMQWVLYVCAAILALMVAIFGVQVVLRYFFSSSLLWAEEAVRFLMIWMSLLTAAVVVWKRGHIAVDIFVSLMPASLQRVLSLLVQICALLFFATATLKGIQYLDVVSYTTAPALGITMDVVYLAVPISGALVAIALVYQILCDLRHPNGEEPGANGGGHAD